MDDGIVRGVVLLVPLSMVCMFICFFLFDLAENRRYIDYHTTTVISGCNNNVVSRNGQNVGQIQFIEFVLVCIQLVDATSPLHLTKFNVRPYSECRLVVFHIHSNIVIHRLVCNGMKHISFFFSIKMFSSYAANFAALLTIERMTTPINSVEELSQQRSIQFGTLHGSSTMEFFKVNIVFF